MLEVLSPTAPRIGDLELGSYHLDPKIAQFDLSLHLWKEGGGYLGRFEYCTDLFHPETVERLSSNFERLLQAIVNAPQQTISNIPILTTSERNRIVNKWNNTEATFPAGSLLHQLFEGQVDRTPERVAIRAGVTTLSYAELDMRANRMARALRACGVCRGQRVGLCIERGADLIAAVLGILKSGAAFRPTR
jgi:non-ribosomal peptide synthetase component F